MNTLTISDMSDDLRRRLADRAKANHRSIEDEALCCLRTIIEGDDEALNAFSDRDWTEIEQSVCDAIHDRGTPMTDADFKRYREMARGRTGK